MNLFEETPIYRVHKYKDREEWLKGRVSGIGGSACSCLVGKNPWKSNKELWQEKKGIVEAEDISDKPCVKYGNDAEDLLRKLFQLDYPQYDVQYSADTILQNKETEWLLYSPDGLLYEPSTGRKGILEIKTTTILSSSQKEKWKGCIPDNYYCQVLHGLLVTGFDFVVLKAQLKYEYKGEEPTLITKHFRINREEVEDDLKWLFESEKEQWEKYYVTDIEPPTLLDI